MLPGTPLSEPGTPLWLGQRQPTTMQQGTAGAHRYQHSSPTPSPLRCRQLAICSNVWLPWLVLQHMSGPHGLPNPAHWVPLPCISARSNWCLHGSPSPDLLGWQQPCPQVNGEAFSHANILRGTFMTCTNPSPTLKPAHTKVHASWTKLDIGSTS